MSAADIEKVEKIDWNAVPEETVNPQMKRRIISGERMTVSRITFTDGFLVPLHAHENEQITEVVRGTMRFRFGEDRAIEMDVHAGEAVIIPPNVPHEALIIGEVEEMDIFVPRREDWLNKTDAYLRK